MTKPPQFREGTGKVLYGWKFKKMYEPQPSIVARYDGHPWAWTVLVGCVVAAIIGAVLIVGYAR